MNLRPLRNSILFTFLDETSGQSGAFSSVTKSGIVLQKLQSAQKEQRWGLVKAVGPDVVGVEVGEYILIEPLQWTIGTTLEDKSKIWRTIDEKVLVVTADIADTETD